MRKHFALEIKSQYSAEPSKVKMTNLLDVISHYQLIIFTHILIHSHAF